MQSQLSRLLANGKPRGLDIADIIQHKAANGNNADILKGREVAHNTLCLKASACRAENPRYKCYKAVVSLWHSSLQIAYTDKVLHTLVWRLNMPVHHCCRCRQIHHMRLMHYLYPLFNARLGGRDNPSYSRHKNLRTCARQ